MPPKYERIVLERRDDSKYADIWDGVTEYAYQASCSPTEAIAQLLRTCKMFRRALRAARERGAR